MRRPVTLRALAAVLQEEHEIFVAAGKRVIAQAESDWRRAAVDEERAQSYLDGLTAQVLLLRRRRRAVLAQSTHGNAPADDIQLSTTGRTRKEESGRSLKAPKRGLREGAPSLRASRVQVDFPRPFGQTNATFINLRWVS